MEVKALNSRELCDLELLLNGGFKPLTGFLNEKDYISVLLNSRLSNQKIWTIPICLAITAKEKKLFEKEKKIILQDQTGLNIAYLTVEDIYPYSLTKECLAVFGAYDLNHPYQQIMNESFILGAKFYIGGRVEQIQPIPYYDFQDLRHSPAELKAILQKKNLKKIVAFQTRNPLHKSHFHLTLNSLSQAGKNACLLLHPVVGMTQNVDLNYSLRVNCYKKLLKYYQGKAILSLLPLSMRMAGPKEAVWHALIRKNFGATHFIIGRDHASPSYKKQNQENFYTPYEAQELLLKHHQEIDIIPITSQAIAYVKETNSYLPVDQIAKNHTAWNLSGTKQREILEKGDILPEWFSFPEIIRLLQSSYKKKSERGFCIYFVGIPASGKSTIANILQTKLAEVILDKKITLLDADIIRKNLSRGLGFSIKDRKTNIQRIGYVASEIVKHHGICLVANIAPFAESRENNKKLIKIQGEYIEVYVATPLKECIKRDPKGLYKKAKKGIIANLTGYNDTFEEPQNADLVLHTLTHTAEECAQKVLLEIKKRGFIDTNQT